MITLANYLTAITNGLTSDKIEFKTSTRLYDSFIFITWRGFEVKVHIKEEYIVKITTVVMKNALNLPKLERMINYKCAILDTINKTNYNYKFAKSFLFNNDVISEYEYKITSTEHIYEYFIDLLDQLLSIFEYTKNEIDKTLNDIKSHKIDITNYGIKIHNSKDNIENLVADWFPEIFKKYEEEPTFDGDKISDLMETDEE